MSIPFREVISARMEPELPPRFVELHPGEAPAEIRPGQKVTLTLTGRVHTMHISGRTDILVTEIGTITPSDMPTPPGSRGATPQS